MNNHITISLKKDSTDGQTLCRAAESVGLAPEDILMGACLNVARRARAGVGNALSLPALAPVQAAAPEPTPAPKLPPAPSSGILKGVPAA